MHVYNVKSTLLANVDTAANVQPTSDVRRFASNASAGANYAACAEIKSRLESLSVGQSGMASLMTDALRVRYNKLDCANSAQMVR